jgi:hypothetical protein
MRMTTRLGTYMLKRYFRCHEEVVRVKIMAKKAGNTF